MEANLKLDKSDRPSFHDILFNVYDLDELSEEQIDAYWEKVPLHLKHEAAYWGVSDTVVRENICEWLSENKITLFNNV